MIMITLGDTERSERIDSLETPLLSVSGGSVV